MSDAAVGILRFLHILSALAWLGGIFFWAMVVAPAIMRGVPEPHRRPALEALLPKATRFILASGVAAIVFGMALLGAMHGGDYQTPFQVQGYGSALAIGVVGGFLLLIHNFGVMLPRTRRFLRAMRETPAPATMEGASTLATMGKALTMQAMVAVLLGTIALGGMVWAVNYFR